MYENQIGPGISDMSYLIIISIMRIVRKSIVVAIRHRRYVAFLTETFSREVIRETIGVAGVWLGVASAG